MYGFVDNIARQHRQRALCYALNLSKKKRKRKILIYRRHRASAELAISNRSLRSRHLDAMVQLYRFKYMYFKHTRVITVMKQQTRYDEWHDSIQRQKCSYEYIFVRLKRDIILNH